MDTQIELLVNGQTHTVQTSADRSLLEVLREELGLTGSKYGCGEGSCRACVVLSDGRPITSCTTPVSRAAGKSIITIEGLAKDGALHPVQEAFIAEDAMQCGYCVPGMILTAVALLENNAAPTDSEIVTFMNGNVCRCCNYPKLLAAVKRAAGSRPAEVSA